MSMRKVWGAGRRRRSSNLRKKLRCTACGYLGSSKEVTTGPHRCAGGYEYRLRCADAAACLERMLDERSLLLPEPGEA